MRKRRGPPAVVPFDSSSLMGRPRSSPASPSETPVVEKPQSFFRRQSEKVRFRIRENAPPKSRLRRWPTEVQQQLYTKHPDGHKFRLFTSLQCPTACLRDDAGGKTDLMEATASRTTSCAQASSCPPAGNAIATTSPLPTPAARVQVMPCQDSRSHQSEGRRGWTDRFGVDPRSSPQARPGVVGRSSHPIGERWQGKCWCDGGGSKGSTWLLYRVAVGEGDGGRDRSEEGQGLYQEPAGKVNSAFTSVLEGRKDRASREVRRLSVGERRFREIRVEEEKARG